MTPLLLAALAALGAYLLVTPGGGRVLPTASRAERRSSRAADIDTWLRRAGLVEVDRREFVAVVMVLFVVGGLLAFAVFGGIGPPILAGSFAASFPVAGYRSRARSRRQRAHESWPRLIEEVRVQTGSLGRSIPQAMFAAGRKAPDELRPAFAAAHREWLLTTDLAATMTTLKTHLADPTADMVCETLLVAHELGGTDLDHRLEALAVDRFEDVQGRKDSHARQAAARFARGFVIVVPAGMAVAGMSIGDGRAAYRTATGQALVLVALTMIVACWFWSGRIMRLPEPERVFSE